VDEQQPWLPPKFKAFAAIVTAENLLFSRIVDLLKKWASRLRTAVFGAGWRRGVPTLTMPDPFGIRTTSTWFAEQLDNEVLVEIREIVDFASHDIADPTPDSMYRVTQAVEQARNRLVRVPDSVFNAVRAETMKATTEGWSIDELADEIDSILADAGAERWKNRARTIARTEAVAAYNAGTYSGFQSYAASVPGPWEKIWLETHDHRTRDTHREGVQGFGGQRVPLMAMFRHGDVQMPYPGWPLAPAAEVVNCRCSLLLAREGEIIDFGNRHYKGGA
jgi:hypothetical protein